MKGKGRKRKEGWDGMGKKISDIDPLFLSVDHARVLTPSVHGLRNWSLPICNKKGVRAPSFNHKSIKRNPK